MATWDSADLLAQFNELAGRPSTDSVTTASKYARLSRSQMTVIEDAAAIYPYCMYRSGGPTTLSTSDSKVFTFGTDGNATHAMGPVGHVAIFRNLADYPDSPLIEGTDYLDEGTQIRIPNNRTEGTLYWTGIPIPADISASVEPALRPAPTRRLIVIKAVETFGREGGQDFALADDMALLYQTEFAKHMLVWRTRFRRGGALGMTTLDRALLT